LVQPGRLFNFVDYRGNCPQNAKKKCHDPTEEQRTNHRDTETQRRPTQRITKKEERKMKKEELRKG